MKKITAALFAVALAFAVTSHAAHAQVVQTEASSTPVASGGYSTPCFYMRQTNEWTPGYVCADADYNQFSFAFDGLYREAILAPWRQHIFVDVPVKYGWK